MEIAFEANELIFAHHSQVAVMLPLMRGVVKTNDIVGMYVIVDYDEKKHISTIICPRISRTPMCDPAMGRDRLRDNLSRWNPTSDDFYDWKESKTYLVTEIRDGIDCGRCLTGTEACFVYFNWPISRDMCEYQKDEFVDVVITMQQFELPDYVLCAILDFRAQFNLLLHRYKISTISRLRRGAERVLEVKRKTHD